ncbi:hypothetical protein A1O7_05530 [Cladophialophora yegresii CBS 114405]|uniref:MalT-like TPR region domain-containing protein n=1 Tax=Cladophialophora yegresii CBS 114405 TaxID=1182544 RepID=W9W0S2_9EURO|nr:uncharacterized protein A1O7_05530 [Cladophialophora yegresii CBS 114405]EXJ58106.1 hypothetical protein A1O7_05530 [Cladophialophora yegresii CBS 114405]
MTSNFAPDFNHTALVQWPSSTVSPHAPILRPLPAVGSQSSVTSLADFEEESQETSTAVVKWSRSEFTICRRCSPPHSHRDFDFNESIDSLENKFPLAQTDYLDMRTFSGNARLDEHLSAELHKLTASQWAAPCYMQCSKDARRDALERSKAHSMDALQYALEHNNEFILPALSWVILVLGQTERKQLLAHFLRDSCALIDRQPRVRRSFTYATPFRYAWAWARDDEEDMNRVGDDLERSHIQIGQIWGTEHPNYFVSGYLFAWHLIRKGEYDKAIRMLTESLPVCERRMGRHDLLTVSCLAVVSRAHSEIGNLRLAVEYCQRAMAATELLVADQHRSEVHQVHRPVLKRFSLELLERRASLTLHLRDHLSAEKQMWRVLHLRGHLDGLDSGGTWSAAQKLGPMLEGRGYTAASEKLMNFIRERYRWEQLNAWYREDAKTRQPPPQPPAPPCWWPFRRKDGQMGCPACPDTQPEAEQSYNFSTRRIQSRHHLDPCFGMLLDTEC